MMKIVMAVGAVALAGLFSVSHAQTAKPAAAAPTGPSAMDMAVDRAVANYKKNKGIAMDAKPASMGAKAAAKK
jgi:hypothetical protein